MQDFSARQSLPPLRQSYVSRRQAQRQLIGSELTRSLRSRRRALTERELELRRRARSVRLAIIRQNSATDQRRAQRPSTESELELRRRAERSVRLAIIRQRPGLISSDTDRRQAQRPLTESELELRRRPRSVRLAIIRQRQGLISSATDQRQILDLFWSYSVEIRWLEEDLKEQTQRLLIEKEELISRLLTLRLTNGTQRQEPISFATDLRQSIPSLFESFHANMSLLEDLRETQRLLTQSKELITRKLGWTHNTQSEEFATNLRQRVASLFQSYADDIRRLGYLQAQTMRLLIYGYGLSWLADEAAVLRPKPASKASVEALEKLVLDGGGDQCSVCLNEMVRGHQVTRLPCSHVFHGNCLAKWLTRGHTCPLCRFKLPTE